MTDRFDLFGELKCGRMQKNKKVTEDRHQYLEFVRTQGSSCQIVQFTNGTRQITWTAPQLFVPAWPETDYPRGNKVTAAGPHYTSHNSICWEVIFCAETDVFTQKDRRKSFTSKCLFTVAPSTIITLHVYCVSIHLKSVTLPRQCVWNAAYK